MGSVNRSFNSRCSTRYDVSDLESNARQYYYYRSLPKIATTESTPSEASFTDGKESPGRVAEFARKHPLVPVIKAMGVSSKRDLADAEAFDAADAFLFDAKPPAGADREGGHGRTFDWSILKGFRIHDHEDWTLSGGLTPENVAEAIAKSGAPAVDVSSGVEKSPGVKDPAKVRAFIAAAKADEA